MKKGVWIKIQNSNGEVWGEFQAQDHKSIAQMAKSNGVNIPISCGAGACGVCSTKIISGHEYIQIDKITSPLRELPVDQQGQYTSAYTCIAGIKSEYLKPACNGEDGQYYEVILEKDL